MGHHRDPIGTPWGYHRDTLGHLTDPIGEVAFIMGCSRKTISNAIEWSKNPIELNDKRGKKKILKNHHMSFIDAITILHRDMTNAEVIHQLKSNFKDLPESLSEQTIMRARKELGFRFLPPLRACNLSEQGKRKRIAFCLNHLMNGTDFKNIIFTDESWFELDRNNRWIYRKLGEISPDVTRPQKAHPKKVMIWGGIGYNFKTQLVFIDGIVNAESYFDDIIIGSNVINDADDHWGINKWVLQQDNARPHVANTVVQSMDYMEINFIDDWPPCSPDINPIEIIWAIMKVHIEKLQPKSIDDLKKLIIDVWNNLTFDTINGLIEEMPRRCATIVQNGGVTIQKMVGQS